MNTTTISNPDPNWAHSGVCLTIHNVILDPEKLSPTPSFLDNLDEETELDLRILGCELIQDSGILMKLPQVAMATAQVLYQRFFYSKSFVRHHYEHYSMACVYLAAKIEENPRRLRDVINVFHHMRIMRQQKPIIPILFDQDYFNLKNQVIKAERRVLKELGFCVHGKHPHKLIICYLQALGMERNHKLVQISWNYMNDSLRTDVFVRYYPETIACACIFLAARQLAVPLPNNPPWWEMFNVTESAIHTISLQLLRLYARDKPNLTVLEAKLTELRKVQADSKNKYSTGNANNGTGSGTNSAVKGGGSSPITNSTASATNLSKSLNSTAVANSSTTHVSKSDQNASYNRRGRSRSVSRDRKKGSKKSPIASNGFKDSKYRKVRRSRSRGSSSRSSSRHRHKRKSHRVVGKRKKSSKKRNSRSRSPIRTPKAYKHRSRSSSHSKSRSRSKSPLISRHQSKKSAHNRGHYTISSSQEMTRSNKQHNSRNNNKPSHNTNKKIKYKRTVSNSSASSYSSSPPVPRKKQQDLKRHRDAKSSSISSPEHQINKRKPVKSSLRRSRSRDRRR